MDKEDFVTYEQAIMLKKLRFDLPVNHCYHEDGTISEIFYDAETDESNDEPTSYGNLNQYDENYTLNLSAPTLAQAQKWLRKEKGLYLIWDMEQQYSNHISKFAWYVNDCHGYIINTLASEFEYDSPEKALSTGITECLKLLEK